MLSLSSFSGICPLAGNNQLQPSIVSLYLVLQRYSISIPTSSGILLTFQSIIEPKVFNYSIFQLYL
jgi:hypothetical protein